MADSSPISPVEKASGDADLPTVPWDRVERFIGQLTHDIRNGLNALELQLTYLVEITADPEAVDEVKRVRATVGNITRHLQTLRIATGSVKPYPLEYPATEFFDDLRERLVKLHPTSRATVSWDITLVAETMLAVDPELTLNALLELLANALAFRADDASQIRAIVSTVDGAVTFTLCESQPVPPDVTPQEWGRAPLLTTRRGAYGLGLFRVRRSLEAQAGSLEVSYSKENKTLTTRATLPAAPQK